MFQTFVNITKGCDNFVLFCVGSIYLEEGNDLAMSELIGDIDKLVERGVKEVTLLGQM